jgi:hypothetical protein
MMVKRRLLVFVVGGALSLSTGFALAADQEPAQQTVQLQEREQIYGSELMTKEERAEYRAKMRAAKTKEEREKIRKEHHERMKERAKAQGVTLPDEPPAIGGGMGPGSGGMGPGRGGMGPGGGGMGPGGGRGRGR